MKRYTVLMIFSLLVTGAAAQENLEPVSNSSVGESSGTEAVTTVSQHVNLSELQESYNSRSDQIPGFVGSIIGDQTITVNLSELETGEKVLKEDIIGVKTNGVRTEDIQWGAMDDPSLKIWITQENIEQLREAENTQKTLKQMFKNKEIRYETYTLGTSIKMGIMNFFLSF